MTDEEGRNYNSDLKKITGVIPKCSFESKKPGKDGLLLQVHHTLPEGGGRSRSYRFTSSSFDLNGERLAISDSLGNAFVVDLQSHKFWMLPKVQACNFFRFVHYAPRKREILVGSVSGPLLFINSDTGEVTGELAGHKESPFIASFAEDEPYCLTACSSSAIIWDLRSNALVQQLMLRSSKGIKQVKFMPVSNNIFTLFEDNSVYIWKLGNLECTKQIFPDEFGGPNIKAMAFTKNGRGMVMGGQSATLAVFLLDNWTLQKLIALPDNCKGVKQLEFVPQLFDGGANKVLAALTSNCSVIFVDTETSVLLKALPQREGCVSRLESNLSGKYVVLVMQTGEVNIYISSQLLSVGQKATLISETQIQQQSSTSVSQRNVHRYTKEPVPYFDVRRLRPILKEFGEYPENHRSLIWRSILNLPENQGAYVGLINKGIHPAFAALEKVFPLSDRSLLSSVKRLLSCLAYWSPLFIQVKYLPILVLPFVKLMRHDQFACFETIASVIVNWCQGWFEYVPYPPLSVLDTVKTLLMTHDDQLVTHYTQCGVSTDLYIWSLLETAFYEVLGWNEWQQLWDHILSNHPSFLLFAVVAFNIICHSSLIYLRHLDDFEHFFHTEVVINIKQLITKSYLLWSTTDPEIHPKHNVRKFRPLGKGNMYQVFTDYPKNLLDQQLDKLSSFFEEQVDLEAQKDELTKQKLGFDADQSRQTQAKLRDAKLREQEIAYKHALMREESRLDDQRKNVSVTRRHLREKEAVVRSQAIDKTLQDKADKYARLEKLVEQFEKKKGGSELQSSVGCSSSNLSTNPSSLRLQHASVVHHLSKLRKLRRQTTMPPVELKGCIRKFEELLVKLESALEKEPCSRQLKLCQVEQIAELEDETLALEDEAEQLLKKLTVNSDLHPSNCRPHSHSQHGAPWSKSGKSQCYCCSDTKKS